MRKYTVALSVAVLILGSACTDRTAAPTAPHSVSPSPSYSVKPGQCFTPATLSTLIKTMLGAGHPQLNAALGKLAAMIIAVAENKIPQAQAAARDLIAFLNAQLTPTTPASQKAQIQATINAILCYVGLPPDTYIVLPSTQTQVVVATGGNTGLSVPGGSITVPTIFTINTLDPNGPSPLLTKLDQYPTYVTVSSSTPPTQPVVVAICLGVGVPPDVFARLRLGHQRSSGFEIADSADASFLGCPTSLASASRVPGWLRSLASLVLPKVAYAKMRMFASGGVGGSAIDFSPFGAVDYGLFATGGVGGSAIDFQQKKPRSATSQADATATKPGVSRSLKASGVGTGAGTGTSTVSKQVSGSVCVSDATVGTAVDPACRPMITITTAKGTILTGIPITWGNITGGGSIAVDTLATKGCALPFGQSATDTTNASGTAAVCWTLGPSFGPNSVDATPNFGGDAPPGVEFLDGSGNVMHGLRFTANGLRIIPTASATGETTTFDGLPHPGSGTCSNTLTPAYSYTAADNSVSATAPTNIGTYTLTVTCGDDGPVYAKVTATATISIGLFTPTVTVVCAQNLVFNGADQPAACSASATGVNNTPLAGPVPVTYGPTTPPHNTGAYTATGNFTATGNYAAASGNAGFSIAPAASVVTVTCTPSSVQYTSAALTPCSAAATGVGGLNQPLPVTYLNNINVGTNTASASATYTAPNAGDPNHTGNSGSTPFSITPAPTSISGSCLAAVYNGAVQSPCSASVSGAGLASTPVAVVYSPLTVRDAGLYQASATYSAPSAGDPNHTGSSWGPVGFAVGTISATATAGTGTMKLGGPVPSLPCVVGGLLTADAGKVTCTTSVPATLVPGANTTTPGVSQVPPLDYTVTGFNGTLTVHYVQSGCFASPVASTLPSPTSSSNPRKGTSVTVKCRLLDATGKPVQTASGTLAVQDMGVTGVTAGSIVLSGASFNLSGDRNFDGDDGFYSYTLSTSPAGFVSGHYYLLTATWNDGSTTTGYVYVR